jgi:hypothetical protein
MYAEFLLGFAVIFAISVAIIGFAFFVGAAIADWFEG